MRHGLIPDWRGWNLSFSIFAHCPSRVAFFLSSQLSIALYYLFSSWLLAVLDMILIICLERAFSLGALLTFWVQSFFSVGLSCEVWDV